MLEFELIFDGIANLRHRFASLALGQTGVNAKTRQTNCLFDDFTEP